MFVLQMTIWSLPQKLLSFFKSLEQGSKKRPFHKISVVVTDKESHFVCKPTNISSLPVEFLVNPKIVFSYEVLPQIILL